MAALHPKPHLAEPAGRGAWCVELLFALPIVALVAYLFYTWFAVLDRYFIFLYFHDMGAEFDTTPFGWVTVGRYWMSGLVAGGAVMVPYTAVNLILGRAFRRYRAPKWGRLWVLCVGPLLVAIPVIVMTVNDPVLPISMAARVTGVTLIGLALALALGEMAAMRPVACALVMVDGFALACLLVSLASLESYPRWAAQGKVGVIYRHLSVVAVGLVLLLIMSIIHYLRRRSHPPSAGEWFVAGLDVCYLLLPLYHHLCWCKDDGSRTDLDYFAYIPSADNYFARSGLLQTGVWLAVALIVLGLTRLRKRMSARRGRSRVKGNGQNGGN